MIVGRVVGNVWATRKHPTLEKCKLLLVQAMEAHTGKVTGEPSLAVDKNYGAGPGDTVLLVDEGNSARMILENPKAPVRLVVCGIVDSATMKSLKYH